MNGIEQFYLSAQSVLVFCIVGLLLGYTGPVVTSVVASNCVVLVPALENPNYVARINACTGGHDWLDLNPPTTSGELPTSSTPAIRLNIAALSPFI